MNYCHVRDFRILCLCGSSSKSAGMVGTELIDKSLKKSRLALLTTGVSLRDQSNC
jgi:hypothetical protein